MIEAARERGAKVIVLDPRVSEQAEVAVTLKPAIRHRCSNVPRLVESHF